MTYLDIAIKGGRIIDGSGNVWFRADVGIKDGEIVLIGKVDADQARQVLDVSDLIVAPGFIDAHTHSDQSILIEPDAESSIFMGTTTHVAGNCGSSPGPLKAGQADALLWESILKPDWSTLGEFFDRVEKNGTAINLGSLVGHGTIRGYIMGNDFARDATVQEMEAMKRQVADAMEQGALGLSSGLNYGAGKFAGTDELVELCRVVAQYGGVYATHVRGQGDTYREAIAEAIEIGERSGVPVELAHMCPFPPNVGKSPEFMAAVTAARLRGLDVTIDVIQGDGVASLTDMLPPWTAEGGVKAQLDRLADPELRERIKRELRGEADWTRNGPALLTRAGMFDQFGVYEAKDKSIVGLSWAELGKRQNKDPLDVILDYMVDEGAPRGTIERIMDMNDLKHLVSLPYQMFASDTTPLPLESRGPLGQTASTPAEYGSYPWFIRNFVRESQVLTLESAIRKMTSLPAQRFKLRDRGLVREGLAADIVVFDPDKISDRGTWENPRQAPVGIEYVLVNGQVVLDRGKHTGARPGKVLRI